MTVSIALAMGILFLSLAARMPIAFALMLAGTAGLVSLDGFDIANSTIGRAPYATLASYTLAVIPLFIATGMFVKQSGLAEATFQGFARWFRRVPGQTGIVTILSCAAFGAVSGSSVATAATMGRIAIKEMIRTGFSRAAAGGIVATGGTLGIIIPPSIALVIYGIITGESIGRLLLAGIVPGLLSALAYIIWILISSWTRVKSAARTPEPSSSRDVPVAPSAGGTDFGRNVRLAAPPPVVSGPREAVNGTRDMGAFGILTRIGLIFGIIMGSVFFGIVTVTEAAALGAALGLLFLLFDRRRAGLVALRGDIVASVGETVRVTAMIFALLIGGTIFSTFIVRTGVVRDVSDSITQVALPPTALLVLVLLMLIPLGMFLDGLSLLIVSMPLLHPIVTELGFDGIWFGILVIKFIELGLITPPVGLNVYVTAGTTEELTPEDVFKGVVPFFAVEAVVIAMLIAVPGIVTFLPNMAFS